MLLNTDIMLSRRHVNEITPSFNRFDRQGSPSRVLTVIAGEGSPSVGLLVKVVNQQA